MDYTVETEGLTRVFGGFTAVDHISLSINKGEICGFVGPNGAGKSTFIRMLCGVLEPSSGSGKVLGYDLARETEEIKKRIGYMSQKFSLYGDLTVLENLEFYAGAYDIPKRERKERIHEILSMAQLEDRGHELTANLSGGLKQRLALGCAIMSRPDVVFLDEPTSGVSPTTRRAFFNIIHELANQGTTVIVTTHFMDEAERCHRIAFISNGRLLAFDAPQNLKRNILEGFLVEFNVDEPMKKISEIEMLPYVLDCSVHGSLIHVHLPDGESIARLQSLLGVEPRVINPSLEDVFIALAKSSKRRVS